MATDLIKTTHIPEKATPHIENESTFSALNVLVLIIIVLSFFTGYFLGKLQIYETKSTNSALTH